MSDCLVQASCLTADFAAVEAALRQWPEVESVGSLRPKKNNKRDLTTVFITFKDAVSAAESTNKLNCIPGLIVDESKLRDVVTKPSSKASRPSRDKDITAELLKAELQSTRVRHTNNRPHVSTRSDQLGQQPPLHQRGSRGRGRGRGQDRELRGRGKGGQRGGRSVFGAQQEGMSPPQQAVMQQALIPPPPPNFLPPTPFEASVAFVDNIPFGTPNDVLMDLFTPYGRILDINRLEMMAMICYDNPESVQQCIQHVNGQSIKGHTLTVSSGTVRIPAHIAAHIGV